MDPPPHFLIVAFPVQSHLNPALQLAHRLLQSGALVTLATTVSASKRMANAAKAVAAEPTPTSYGLRFATFSDGYDDGFRGKGLESGDGLAYVASLKRRGSETLSELIERSRRSEREVNNSRPGFDYVVHTILLSWAAEVARQHHIPSALLWVQPASMLNICYCYFNGYSDVIDGGWSVSKDNDPSWSVKLPGLPPLGANDLPTYFSPSNPYTFALPSFQELFEELERQPEADRRIFMNTFDALELEPLKALTGKFNVRTVGPLLPLALFKDKGQFEADPPGNYAYDHYSSRVDLFKQTEEDYLKWLDSKEESSVVYVSFGSISVLSRRQIEELARGLIECRRPFLWIMRPKEEKGSEKGEGREEELGAEMRWLEEVEREKGLVVPWCSQVEVLSHKAVGCFVTHCGWNSSLESLAFGVPVVGIPQWADQVTNAKMLEDVWRVGVRARANHKVDGDHQEEEGTLVVEREELRRCLELVMQNEKIRRNARTWKELAVQAVKEGGSSETNLREFVNEVVSRKVSMG